MPEKRAEKSADKTAERSRTAIKPNPESLRLKRIGREPVVEDDERAASVSAGPIDRVIELTFNPTREKIREVTIIDRIQGRLFPQLDMVNMLRHYCLEIATFRQNASMYKSLFKRERPISPDPLDEYLFRVAQWQKSVAGKNLERATDIALAETEARAGEEEVKLGADAWQE